MGRITIDQSHQIIGALIANVQWSEIDFDTAGLQDAIIRNPKAAGLRFTEWLKNGAHMVVSILSVFKTIKVGTGMRTADDFCVALQRANCRSCHVGGLPNDLLSEPGFTAAEQENDVDLVVLTTSQLTGNEDGGTTTELFAGAARIGLDKCQFEDGPQLRLQYLDQPLNEWLLIGMEPIAYSDGNTYVLSVARSGDELLLLTVYANPDRRWSGDDRWVFRRRK